MDRKKIAFVWDFTVSPIDLASWEDGLNAALKWMAHKHPYEIYTIAEDDPSRIYEMLDVYSPDIIIAWGSLDRPSFAGLREYADVVALCFAGGPTEHPHTENFDVIFVENDTYLEAFTKQGINAVKAFGTNHSLFVPMEMHKKWTGFYPAAFARWKRHELFATALKTEGLAIGKPVREEPDVLAECLRHNVTIMTQLPYKVLPFLYNQSEFAVITASSVGGSQRVVLEAMACNVWPIVMKDNEKTSEYVLDSEYGSIVEPTVEAITEEIAKLSGSPRDERGRKYIESKYSAEIYADIIHREISKFTA